MKTTFKPLGIAAAVAAATAGYAGITNAVSLADNSGLGDLAIVPYYTVQAGFSTGVSIINTSSYTQVVKMRLRRAPDSMDSLDFNVILSPDDVYTGYFQRAGDELTDEIRWYSNDNSCTAPQYSVPGLGDTPSYFVMPSIYREGADEGYIEVIGMAAADPTQPISASAVHSSDTPFDCERVRDNFFPGANASDYGTTANLARKGVIDSDTTHQLTAAGSTTVVANSYMDTGNVLKVSYFIKNDVTGLEFGNDATHIANFMEGPSMTNQRLGLFEGDLQGFDYPDLNGGAVYSAVVEGDTTVGQRGRYELLRNDAIGGAEVINDWSENTTDMFTVDTDWIVTTPGQYLMTNLFAYLSSIADGSTTDCLVGDPSVAYDSSTGANCDFRDIPMTATFIVFNREERGIIVDEGDLVVSPQPPGEITQDVLDQEVNVIRWGTEKVLGSGKEITVPKPSNATAGWSRLAVTPSGSTTQAICDITGVSASPNGQPSIAFPLPTSCASTDSPIPLVGFVAWQRNFGTLPEANYGRIIRHSYTLSS